MLFSLCIFSLWFFVILSLANSFLSDLQIGRSFSSPGDINTEPSDSHSAIYLIMER